jgi:hypothetical protein
MLVVHTERLGDGPAAFAGLEALDCLALLVVGELAFWTEPFGSTSDQVDARSR